MTIQNKFICKSVGIQMYIVRKLLTKYGTYLIIYTLLQIHLTCYLCMYLISICLLLKINIILYFNH